MQMRNRHYRRHVLSKVENFSYSCGIHACGSFGNVGPCVGLDVADQAHYILGYLGRWQGCDDASVVERLVGTCTDLRLTSLQSW